MAGRAPEIGATAHTVAGNVERLRKVRNLTWTQLSERLESLGWNLTPVAIKNIESVKRRVDVDDLVALAAALGVSPATLLGPPFKEPTETAQVLNLEVNAVLLWEWLRGNKPLPGQSLNEFLFTSSPPWIVQRMLHHLQKEEEAFAAEAREELLEGVFGPDRPANGNDK